jgi:serine/threonine protein kinase
MAVSSSCTEFIECLEKSKVLDKQRLEAFLQRLQTMEGAPDSPKALALFMIREGLLTPFQGEQLLQGKYRNFFIRDKYKVMERLGSGGNGIVFLCEHTLMRRLVAIKVLPTSLASDPGIVERFRREARAAAQLKHPNIVTAHDVDQVGKMHFLVLEHIDGHNLHHIVKACGPMDPVRAAHYIRQAAEGLQHAHDLGLVHRDIKPGNMLLDRSGTVKILDMGLARFFNEDDNLTTQQEAGAILGTADFLAPEQALDSHSADIRCDIYSLGISFYFLVAGASPFEGGTTAQKLIWHQMRQPKPIREVRPEVPEAMAAVIAKMIAKDPAQRYQLPAEVSAALAPWTSEPIPPPKDDEMPRHTPAIRALCQPETMSRTMSMSWRAALATPSLTDSGAGPASPLLAPLPSSHGKQAMEALVELTDEGEEVKRPQAEKEVQEAVAAVEEKSSKVDTTRTTARDNTPVTRSKGGAKRPKPQPPSSRIKTKKKPAQRRLPFSLVVTGLAVGGALLFGAAILAVWLIVTRPKTPTISVPTALLHPPRGSMPANPPPAVPTKPIVPPTQPPQPPPPPPPKTTPLVVVPPTTAVKPPPPPPPPMPAALRVEFPIDYQVFQRQSRTKGLVVVRGEATAGCDRVEVRILGKSLLGDLPDSWQKLTVATKPAAPPMGPMANVPRYDAAVPVNAGGWYVVELRAMKGEQVVGTGRVEHVGVGEVFIVAGQGNASNKGEGQLRAQSGLVASFSGDRWQPAADPMPGVLDGSTGGSVWPAFGDALVQKLGVPIGIASVAKADSTLEQWKPDGDAFKALTARMKYFGLGGFRAVLWHQDEQDAKTIPLAYANHMSNLITTASQVGGRCAWFVAAASYHDAAAPKNQNLLDGQKRLWATKVAYQGPETDGLTGDNRAQGGKGLYFSAKGLDAAGHLWADAVAAVLAKIVKD